MTYESESDSSYVPRAPRFKISNSSEAVVMFARSEESDQQPLAADLVDVSQHGVKLSVPVNLRFEEALQLKIKVVGTELEYSGVASVRHIRAVSDGNEEDRWVVGCAVAPPLSDETFAHLATAAGKERRRFRRLQISAEAVVRRQAQQEGAVATLHNLSSGGICFSSDVQYEIGESIQITLEDNDGVPCSVEASICWQVDGPEGSIAGCQFSSTDSYADVCSCLTEQPAASRRGAEPTSKLVLTAAVLAMFAPPMMTLMFQANKVSAESAPLPVVVVALETPQEETIEGSDVPEQAEVAAQEQLREWVDNTGKHRTQARLVDVTSEYVLLEKPNGRQKKIPLRRLSEVDQTFVRNWQSRQ